MCLPLMYIKEITMKYKFIAADMDGTLLNDESRLSERTKTAIRKALEAGAFFTTATGRAASGVESVSELLDKDMPLIVLNGASVVMSKSREVLFNKYLDISLVKEVYDMGMVCGVSMMIRASEWLWANRESKATIGYRNAYNADMKVISDINDLDSESVYKVLWFETAESIRRLSSEMNEYFKGRLNCHSSLPTVLEFVSIEADKGSAMAEIGRIYGIDRSEMIAVGDGYNDVSMLKYAGLGIAMANAPDDVKAVCKEVTLSNNDDGVAAVIEKYIL